MTQQQERTTSVADQLARDNLRQLGTNLGRVLDGVAAELEKSAKRMKETREAGALFALYRQRRHADHPRSPDRDRREELDAMLRAALEGYDTSFLSDLITFGEFLKDEGGPIWRDRPIR